MDLKRRNENPLKWSGLMKLSAALRDRCDLMIQFNPVPAEGKSFCNATFDGWGCWLHTAAGTTASIPCTHTIFRFHTSRNVTATRKCNENGTWYVDPFTNRPYINYTACIPQMQPTKDHFIPMYIFVVGYSLSIVMLLVSLIIFTAFSQLRCERITVHKNLFVSYVLTGVAWISFYTLVTLNGDVQHDNPAWCQALHILAQYCTTCNFSWMFCEGLYLHVIMTYAFCRRDVLIRVLLFIGWGSPFILTVIYVTVRGTLQQNLNDCWIDGDPLQWITIGPVLVCMVVNILILINIVRLLVTKLRQMPGAPQSRKAVRATLILAPLLGLQCFLFPVVPEEGTLLFDVYLYFFALLTSLQGALVSILYCFCDGEVKALLHRKWTQRRLTTAHVHHGAHALRARLQSES